MKPTKPSESLAVTRSKYPSKPRKQADPRIAEQIAQFHTQRKLLTNAFWVAVAAIVAISLVSSKTSSFENILGAVLIALFALLPSYLWCSGRVFGMPIFPVFALTHLWTHASPLLSEHPIVMTYSPDSRFLASLTVVGFLGLGTAIWFQLVKSVSVPPTKYLVLKTERGDTFFLMVLFASVLFHMYTTGGWFLLDGGVFSLVRGAILGLTALSVFVLAYRFGKRELSKTASGLFIVLLGLDMSSSSASMILVRAMSLFLLSTIAFIMGRQYIPWKTLAIVVLCFALLHIGKGEMRSKYWYQSFTLQPWNYPAFYAEWTETALRSFTNNDRDNSESQSFLERSSTLQQLLLTESETSKGLPYLDGATYAILPELLVPRLFNSEKITSHEGTTILNIHYGRQTREATLTTTIGWGLLAESYANFGLWGCAGLATVLGIVYGYVARWSMNMSLFSARSLFAVLLMAYAFQSEFTAGVYVAALFQSGMTLTIVSFLLMKVQDDRVNVQGTR
ncbi:hypothetical protein V2H45_16720 [Tumidithrix elongata RA019]|uniref:Transmembrane protein n=1 Tax=Tumidithrix elongata BACA0141 TaxID=2716417 RepID=A0AAW9Q6Y9_9CYAN|nr:hypothetical protein [Tumidithrix elongata RA019]